jgi:hypothetical protein
MEVDTDRQGADAHLDNDPLMQAALANDETGVDSSTRLQTAQKRIRKMRQFAGRRASEQEAATPPTPQVFTVPLAEHLSLRERAQKAEREAESYGDGEQQQEQKKEAPDFYSQPDRGGEHVFQSQVQTASCSRPSTNTGTASL